jgi:peptidyl-prolyl cis-trans isomerase C
MKILRSVAVSFLIGFSVIILSACNQSSPVTTSTFTAVLTPEFTPGPPEPSQTPLPPSPTPIPLAAIINGEQITLEEYQGELARYQAVTPITGTILASDPSTIVLDDMINQTLLAQSAAQNGFIVDEAMLQARIKALETQLGGSQALEDWKTAHGYTSLDFDQALKRSIGAAWMRDQIIASVPETGEEVHVRQILLPSAAQADEVYSSLQYGADFLEQAKKFDPITGGDLGWFPRGYLDEPALEEAAFSLQPGQYSQVIETDIGYHILYMVERDTNHILQPDARIALQRSALQEWVSERRDQSEIQIFIP